MANIQSPKPDTGRATTPEQTPPAAPHTPMTVGQQVVLTIKLLVGAGVLIALLWFLDRGV